MNIKKFLPLENFVLVSDLKPEEIKKRLAENIEPEKPFRLIGFNWSQSKPYLGFFLYDSFKISRVTRYRNSFLPVITGEISTLFNKTHICVKMRPMVFSIVFATIWLAIVGAVCGGIIIGSFYQFIETHRFKVLPISLIPFGMFLFGYLMTIGLFKYESTKSKQFLEQLFEAQESPG